MSSPCVRNRTAAQNKRGYGTLYTRGQNLIYWVKQQNTKQERPTKWGKTVLGGLNGILTQASLGPIVS